ncbi:MAG: hypothetical protein PX640_24310 [Microcystis sp. M49629_WE12]|uniref:hypothetical protein n=1 Tax=unclassified Microcystis TaxID=2643300 RepID=UPI0022C7FDD5|nr:MULTISPECIES: hypothetical protein [unclassified Microcystis]MCE2664891.1 hypothetical protein [Microcystis sp. 53602_E8]MCZ8365471.1 hypothetical protein [Microcystis sp. LE19-251.1A]MDJ0567000.1 hypothetical protein [Microcystis sp. M49629_WE12]MCZ8024911.1 hypothetical protein [Microcystis sp. LE19-10.1B]MDJ0606021.1 hypothetical protein [Microcystis sp. M53602_WE12]
MTPSKSVKPYTPHPTPHTLPPQKTFSASPNYWFKVNPSPPSKSDRILWRPRDLH